MADLPLKENTINRLFLEDSGVRYSIPVYQRNYAWDDDQISTLVKDIKDSYDKNPAAPYYIGTLVTFKRDDNVYEVIDGQQRLTTLFLILKAIAFLGGDSRLTAIGNRLGYSARPLAAKTLQSLPQVGEEYETMIAAGFKHAARAIEDYVGAGCPLSEFTDYLLHKVVIIHYGVPKDVDLNHYFEVMNSRGEQLEKHEIVKSKLYATLETKEDRYRFARVWDSCAHMSCYIQQMCDDNEIFQNNMSDLKASCFEDIRVPETDRRQLSIKEFMRGTASSMSPEDLIAADDRFQPLVDFPNFLLLVLKLTLLHNGRLGTFTLDDKELLGQFDDALALYAVGEERIEFVKRFTFNLLKAKYFLDNYVVHHSLNDSEEATQNPWQLEKFYKEGSDTTPRNLVVREEGIMQEELVNLLSMFETSFSPKTRKNYLFYILVHLFKDSSITGYLQFLRKMADKYFYDIYLNPESLNERKMPKPDAFDRLMLKGTGLNLWIQNYAVGKTEVFESVYPIGNANIPLYVFNYTDYRLWLKYAVNQRGETNSSKRREFFDELGCSDFGLEFFNRFYFSRTRKSLEHFYPQANVKDEEFSYGNKPTAAEINFFGNFAMIGADANSAGSNWDPIYKCNRYQSARQAQVSVASIKFRIMMQMCMDNYKNANPPRPQGDEWLFGDMERHLKHMLGIIMSKPD